LPIQKNRKLRKNSVLLTSSIDKFPIVYYSEGEYYVSSKYKILEFNPEVSEDLKSRKELLVIMMNSIISIQSMEGDYKNSNKRSSTKNRNSVIKEPRLSLMKELIVPDIRKLSIEQMDILLELYDKYKNNQIFALETAMDNEHYMEVQKKLFEFLDLPDYDIIINNTKQMYYIRQRWLEKLGLELVD
jgi:hypothetical protein